MSHPVSDALASMTPAERHAYKVEVYRALSNVVGRTFTPRANVAVTIIAASVEHGLLRFVFGVTINGVSVDLSAANPFYFHNPPILVPDPAGDIVRTSTDPQTGLPVEHRYREDVQAALRAMVLDALKDAIQ